MYLAKLYKDINYLDNMKKILLFTSILFFAFSLSTVKAQTIDTVIITDPILCFGEFAEIEVQITQTTIPTPLNYVLEYSNTGALYFQIAIAPLPPATTVGLVQPFTLLISGFYRIKLKDVNGVVLDSYDIYVPQPFPLTVTAIQTDSNLCNGDCTAREIDIARSDHAHVTESKRTTGKCKGSGSGKIRGRSKRLRTRAET